MAVWAGCTSGTESRTEEAGAGSSGQDAESAGGGLAGRRSLCGQPTQEALLGTLIQLCPECCKLGKGRVRCVGHGGWDARRGTTERLKA